jgi:hypothetical protein
MAYINRSFPVSNVSDSWPDLLHEPLLVSPGYINQNLDIFQTGTLSYLEFILMVKKIWEDSHPKIPMFPYSANREAFSSYSFSGNSANITSSVSNPGDNPNFTGTSALDEYPAIVGYSLELRKAHTTEPKPRMRQNVINNEYTIYGQKFQNIISFTIMSKVGTNQDENTTTTRGDLDTAVLCDEIIEAFEDFMLEFTPIFKAAGASDLVYSRRLSDSEINRDGKDVHKRTVTYMLTTEKVFAIKNSVIQHVSGDIRVWVANNAATPDISSVDGSIIVTQTDLFNTATPNS